MTPEEKAQFCQLLALLFAPPDQEMVKEWDGFFSLFEEYGKAWGGHGCLSKEFLIEDLPENRFEKLREEYYRLFEDETGEKISLVESFYKPWTQDPLCPLPFAKEKGYLMGDSGLHLLTLYQHCGLEVSDLFRGMPDHLILELEFLSFLYRHAGDDEIQQFIGDHLDWIPALIQNCERAQAHPFYLSLLNTLRLFLNFEEERLEKKRDGEKTIHSEDP